MRNMMFTACLVANVAMSLEGGVPLQTNIHFSAKEWADIQKLTTNMDQVVLLDGTRLTGTIEKIPKLCYPFGTISFVPSDVLALVLLQDQGQTKMELVTKEGLYFKGNVSKDYFIFSDQGPQRVVFPYKVHWVVFKDQKRDLKKPEEKLYCLKLNNGDLLTVSLGNHPISVTNEQGEMTLKSETIESLYYDGKLHGTLKEASGEQKELPDSSVKDPLFVGKLGNTSRLIRLPWSEIHSLKVSQAAQENSLEGDCALLANRLPGVQITIESSFQKEGTTEEKMAQTESEDRDAPEIAYIFLGNDSKTKQQTDELEDNGIGVNITAEAFDIDESKLEAGEAADSEIEFVSKAKQERPKFMLSENDQPIAFKSVKNTTHTLFGAPLVRNLDINPAAIQNYSYFENNDLEELAEDSDIFDTFLSSEEFEDTLTYSTEFSEFKSPLTEKPAHSELRRPMEKEAMVLVSSRVVQTRDFYIDRDRVTNKEYKKFIEATNYPAPTYWENGDIPAGKENEPVVNISYKDALVYAVWVGKRLPSEEEWRCAVRHHLLNISMDDPIKEWTCTAYSREGSREKKQTSVYSKHPTARKYDIVRVCAGTPASPLSADVCCPMTGFRCASHAQD